MPNYVDPEKRGSVVMAITTAFMGLTTLAVALRFYSRLRVKKWLGKDDVFIGIALLFSLGLGVVVIVANVCFGWDRHLWDVPPEDLEGASAMAFVAKILYALAAAFTRISLICFYQRLVSDVMTAKMKWVLYGSMVWQIVVCVVYVATSVFVCIPVDAYWDLKKAATGKCIDEGLSFFVLGIVNCATDLMVVMLPIPVVMRLHLPLRQRIETAVLLSLGFTVTIASILRTYFTYFPLLTTYDGTWFSYPIWICASVEVYLAVICACVPALTPMFKLLFSNIRTIVRGTSNTAQGANVESPAPKQVPMFCKYTTASYIADVTRTRSQNTSQAETLYDHSESSDIYFCRDGARLDSGVTDEHAAGLSEPSDPSDEKELDERKPVGRGVDCKDTTTVEL